MCQAFFSPYKIRLFIHYFSMLGSYCLFHSKCLQNCVYLSEIEPHKQKYSNDLNMNIKKVKSGNVLQFLKYFFLYSYKKKSNFSQYQINCFEFTHFRLCLVFFKTTNFFPMQNSKQDKKKFFSKELSKQIFFYGNVKNRFDP